MDPPTLDDDVGLVAEQLPSTGRRGRPVADHKAHAGWGSSAAAASSSDRPMSSSPLKPAPRAPAKFGRRAGGGVAPASGNMEVIEEVKTSNAPTSKFEDDAIVKEFSLVPELGSETNLKEQVAAPAMQNPQVQALRDLDEEVLFQFSSASVDGVDLSALHSSLAPPDHLDEPDVRWDFDVLFTSLASAYHDEMAGKDSSASEQATRARGNKTVTL